MTTRANKAVPESSPPITKAANVAEKAITQISEKMGMVAIVVVVAMVFFTTTDVILRYFFNAPISEVYELTGFMMLICGCLTLAWCAMSDKHVRVDVVVKLLKPRAQEILNTINYLMVLGACILMVVTSFKLGLYMMETGAHPTLIKLPYYPFYFILTLGFVLLFFAVLTLLVRSVCKAVKG